MYPSLVIHYHTALISQCERATESAAAAVRFCGETRCNTLFLFCLSFVALSCCLLFYVLFSIYGNAESEDGKRNNRKPKNALSRMTAPLSCKILLHSRGYSERKLLAAI